MVNSSAYSFVWPFFMQGWPYYRPVLIMDGTFLKAKYRETLLTVCGIDANEKVFPLAFAVVESENITS